MTNKINIRWEILKKIQEIDFRGNFTILTLQKDVYFRFLEVLRHIAPYHTLFKLF
jgi:hypothetical protein